MGSNAPNVYDQPEKFQLNPVAEIHYPSLGSGFDFRVVWLHEPTGKLYTARDEGCSCPSPFEDYTSFDSLKEINLSELEAEIRQELMEEEWVGESLSFYEACNFLDKVRRVATAIRR